MTRDRALKGDMDKKDIYHKLPKITGYTRISLISALVPFSGWERIGFANTSPLELVIATENHNINVLDQGKATQLS